MKSTIIVITVLAALLSGCLAGCEKQDTSEQKPVEQTKIELTLAGLKNATYTGIQEQDPVTLRDGVWEGEPFVEDGSSRPTVYFVRDFLLEGDIDKDGVEEAVVLLRAGSGGTGVNTYLAAVRLEDGQLKNLDTVLVGDRIQVRKAGFGAAHVFLEVVRPGPEDAMCCPGEMIMLGWSLAGDKLKPLEVETKSRRLSLAAIAESEWALRWWDRDEPASAEPEITLALVEGRLGGSSGCNSYFTGVKEGEMSGELLLGKTGGTMKMCPEEVMAIEQRYLAQLAGVKKFGFLAGMLALSYEFDGNWGVMLFERRPVK